MLPARDTPLPASFRPVGNGGRSDWTTWVRALRRNLKIVEPQCPGTPRQWIALRHPALSKPAIRDSATWRRGEDQNRTEQDTKRRTGARSRAQHDAVNKLDHGRHFFPGLKTQGAQGVMVCDEGFLLALTREHIGSAHFGQQRRW